MPLRHARCPCCLTASLEETVLSGQQILQCNKCHGLWFEDGALNNAIAHQHDHVDTYAHEEHLGERIGASKRLCRRCDIPMEHYHLLEHYQTEVDCCPRCDGVWLDKEEIDQVLHSPPLRAALKVLNQKLTWRSWVFQFLTSMPIEYNLKTHRTPWVTYLIIALCTLVFVAGQFVRELEYVIFTVFAFDSSSDNALVLAGQLLSYQFLHGGWLHLVSNMYFLWVIGDNLEDALGHVRYFGLYLLSGVAAALAQWAFFDGSNGPLLMVGASGSIAALFGLYLIWFRYASLSFMFIVFQKKLAPHWYFLIWSALNIYGMIIGEGNVAYWAHLGGFAFGVVVGLLLDNWIREQNVMVDLLNRPEAKVRR